MTIVGLKGGKGIRTVKKNRKWYRNKTRHLPDNEKQADGTGPKPDSYRKCLSAANASWITVSRLLWYRPVNVSYIP